MEFFTTWIVFEQIPLFCKAVFFPYYYWNITAIHADKHIMKDESSRSDC